MSTFYKDGVFYFKPDGMLSILGIWKLRQVGLVYLKDKEIWATPFSAIVKKFCSEFLGLLSEHPVYKVMESLERSKFKGSLASKLPRVGGFKKPQGVDYLPYQESFIEYSRYGKNILLADDMGLGKTIQAIGMLNNMKSGFKSALIVCPSSVKYNWEAELKKWLFENKNIKIITGRKRLDSYKSDIVIINYDIIVNHINPLNKINWDVIIIDECHFLKDPQAQRTRALLGEGLKAEYKLALTGTPIVNRPIELFPILNWLLPSYFNDIQLFGLRYCAGHQIKVPVKKKNSVIKKMVWDFKGHSNLEELQNRLRSSIMVRRTKTEVLTQLKGKTRQVIPLDLRVKRLFNIQDFVDFDEFEKSSTFSDKIEFEKVAKQRFEIGLLKIKYVIGYISEVLDSGIDKIVIFAIHTEVLRSIYDAFKSVSVLVDGNVNAKARFDLVEKFQKDGETKLFVGQTAAAGTGITLTASSLVLFAETPWSPGVVSQDEDRCYRIGQNKPVLVQHLVARKTMDEKVIKMLVEKQKIIDSTVDFKVLD